MPISSVLPDYVFEASWEVANKVGGIYTVLSTRAKVLHERLGDHLIFIGPDVWGEDACPFFDDDPQLLHAWRCLARAMGLRCKVGRWRVPGAPLTILVDFHPFFSEKNTIYARMWEDYGVDSLHAYGDYDEASMFAYAAAKVVESYYQHCIASSSQVIFHANEWMTGAAALYLRKHVPQIATVFTTHATSIGRSICGNQKPLYEYLYAYNGDQMAYELNMQSKHSVEKQTAQHVDCFTTVSTITAEECRVLLEKDVNVVLPNGFENDFVPRGAKYNALRAAARQRLLQVANALTGKVFAEDSLIIATSGRYEFRNKGLDLFLSALGRLRRSAIDKEVVAFIAVPGWVKEPRADLLSRLHAGHICHDSLQYPQLTHWLHNLADDSVMNMCMQLGLWNAPEEKVTVIFVPCYLTGSDGIVDIEYYHFLLATDLCIFPSYYEPWGYTPLEAVAFHVPCVTTDLAGFGAWVNETLGRRGEISDGVQVLHRTDHNYDAVAEEIKDTIAAYAALPAAAVAEARRAAHRLAQRAQWKHFITHYYDAYAVALQRAKERINSSNK